MLKRVLAFLLVFSLLFTINSYPAAANSLTAGQKAEHLNKMSIITDFNSIINLDKQITRAEAVVYAARLLGAEDYINANSQSLRKTNFTDVPEYMDYAPYVGFCTSQGIISGVGNGMFNPNGYASEKAFLVILFGVLGYKSGVDFTWNNLYSTAFSVGLVKDISYITKTTDNINFTMADAVNIMFNALSCKIRGTDSTLVERLVEINAIDIKDAVDAGLIDKSAISVRIDSITNVGKNRIMIKFNTDIKELTNNNIEIYETENDSKKLKSSILSQTSDSIILETSSQKKDVGYTVVIRGIISADGNITDKVIGTFKGYGANQIDSDFFRISAAEAVSSNVINVYFTHPVNSNAEYPGYYTILKDSITVVSGDFQNISVKCLNTGDGVAIYLNDDILVPGTKYTLKIDGDLVSRYGTFLNENVDESIDFYAIPGSNSNIPDDNPDELDVIEIITLDKNTIEVHFSKEIDSYFAGQNLNYMIYKPNNTSISIDKVALVEAGEYKNSAVMLRLKNSLESAEKYELYINFLPDITKKSSISNKRYTFNAEYPKTSQLEILDVEAINSRVVLAIVDKPLVPSYAEMPSYYTILNKSGSKLCNPVQVIYTPLDSSMYRIIMLLPANVSLTDKSYKLSISRSLPFYIASISKDDAIDTFSGNKNNYETPTINDAIIVGSNAIKLSFSEEIATAFPNLSVDNYRLVYAKGSNTVRRIPTGVIFIDSHTLILLFDNLSFEKSYILLWDKVTDIFGNSSTDDSGNGGSITVKLGKR
ncbi:MAG: S-layer homology domain-containing protein [Clostridiaceae bacterium]|nr:S-layer homology domain-containing protein [Clostridiaceae bacterium]